MRYSTHIAVLVVHFCSIVNFAQAQTRKHVLRIDGKIVQDKERLQGVSIILFSEGTEVDRFLTSSNGRFKYELPLEKNYFMVFSKDGYRSKYVSITAKNIPEADAAFGYEFGGLEVSLFKDIKGLKNEAVLDQPAAKIIYDTNLYRFVFDAGYFQEMEEQTQALHEELAQLEEKPEELLVKQEEAQKAEQSERKKLDEEMMIAMQQHGIQNPETKSMSINPKAMSPPLNPIKLEETSIRIVETPTPKADPLPLKTNPDEAKPKSIITKQEKPKPIEQPKIKATGNLQSENKPIIEQNTSTTPTFKKEVSREGNKTITRISISQNGLTTNYRRVIADWGGQYYFKDDVAITSITWESDLSLYEQELK